MTVHIFVDETKAKGYVIAAATLLEGDLAAPRKRVQALVRRAPDSGAEPHRLPIDIDPEAPKARITNPSVVVDNFEPRTIQYHICSWELLHSFC